MAEIFISYSRKDSEFARHLSNELHKYSRDVWIDWEDIPRGADWLTEIYASIEAADTFALIVSQHSLTSEICNYEIAHARKFNKRIIPLVRRSIEGDVAKIVKGTWVGETWEQIARENWEAIQHINWLHFADDALFASEFEVLLKTLDEDQPHLKAHTRYLVRALDWERAARNPSFLLVGDEIAAAEVWLTTGESKKPVPDPLHHEYIGASRHAQDERNAQAAAMEQRIAALGRRTRQFSVASLALGGMVMLAVIAVVVAVTQGNVAREQVAVAQRELATATLVQIQAATAERELANANATLAPIPSTLDAAAAQILAGETQVAIIGATLTPVPPTLTTVALQVEDANIQRNIASMLSDGLFYTSEGRTGEASQSASDLALTYPDEPEAHFGSGLIYVALGELAAGINAYNRAIQLDSAFADAYNNRGNAQYAMGDYEKAVEDFTYTIQLNPNYAQAYYNRGVVYGSLGENQQAIEDFTYTIQLNPNYAQAYYNRGTVYSSLGENQQAIEDFTHAIQLNPDHANAYNNRGNARYTLGEDEQAIEDFTRAIQLNPDHADAYNNRGVVYGGLGENQQAIEDYNRAIELDTSNAEFYYNRGNAQYALGDYVLAIADYDRAIELNAGFAEAYLNRGFLYNIMGNGTQALDDWQTAEALLGQLPAQLQEIRDQLEQ